MENRFLHIYSKSIGAIRRLFQTPKAFLDIKRDIWNWKQKFGADGERLAVRQIEKRGYKTIQRNFRCKTGEIDIIAKDGDTLVFVEVKTRNNLRFGSPKHAVTWRKQKKLIRTALYYLKTVNSSKARFRFDVISIVNNPVDGKYQVELIQNAFKAIQG
jgi:putative endonuclease